ncbi:Uracil-DNA glycosylase superfamily [Arcobacter nitrofigilis DSM 7299]|uniref:Type-4 uracil-DNA glycosylase n=1 Tax=Arcobacter nitrofigilis (strain ATCC 33309 / DSM 7299 / CCUG 15893 / LMG 7604 / NCTC 12251 / CI) TaxID=572480 RepID=D5V3W0_ARCNC|nr:uracil-DNA glycosylase [Arcobacter nitrofigilis]ADG92788.1 Uracil-DNA glycosylase superfamily [Arcobacter nitrofigilis DSM 7299]
MTKNLQNKLLYHLNFLKSIGYEYGQNLNFKNSNTEQVRLPDDIKQLEELVKNCHLCQLSKYRENVLFGSGNINSNIMFLKESPTISEDEVDAFYVGKSGELLKNMIEKVLKVPCETVYITNIVKCISPNSEIKAEHVNNCKAYLDKQIELVKPKLLVILGESVYRHFTSDNTAFSEIRGKVIPNNDLDIICTYEPSFLLRNPSSKGEAYEDLLKIKAIMEQM